MTTSKQQSKIIRADRHGWAGCYLKPYQAAEETDFSPGPLPFRDIVRVEIIGPNHDTSFELRYFEIQPGGFSRLERHQHTHTVIAVRGEGAILLDGHWQTLRLLDIAHIVPQDPHQLRNEGDEPFGFFCLVDKIRDRPVPLKADEYSH